MDDLSKAVEAFSKSGASPLDNAVEKFTNPEGHGEFYKGVSAGVDSLQGLGYGVAGLVGQGLGVKPLQQWGAEGMQRNEQEAQRYTPKVGQFKDVHGFGDFANYLKYQTGNLLPSVAESLGAAAVGGSMTGGAGAIPAAVGRTLLKDKLKNYVEKAVAGGMAKDVAEKQAAKAAGAAGATLLNAYGTGVGDIYQNTSDSGRKEGSVAGSLIGAAPYAGLEYLGDINLAKMVGLAGPKHIGNQAALDIGDSLLKTSIRGGLKQAAIEGTTEAGQQGIISGAMELHDPASMALDKALDDMTESFFAAGFGSLIPGMAGGAIHHLQNKPAAAPTPVEQPKSEAPTGPSGLLSAPVITAGAPAASQPASISEFNAEQAQGEHQQAVDIEQARQAATQQYLQATATLQAAGVEIPKDFEAQDFATFAKKFKRTNKGADQNTIAENYVAHIQEAADNVQALASMHQSQQQANSSFSTSGTPNAQPELPGIAAAPAVSNRMATLGEQVAANTSEPFSYDRSLLQQELPFNAPTEQKVPETLPLIKQGPGIIETGRTTSKITEAAPTAQPSPSGIIIPETTPSKTGTVIPLGGKPKGKLAKQDVVKEAKTWYEANREAAQEHPAGPYDYVKQTNPAALDYLGAAKGSLNTDMRDFRMAQEEKQNAVQIESTGTLDVQPETRNGEGVGGQNAEPKQAARKGKIQAARVGNEVKQEQVKAETKQEKAKKAKEEAKAETKQEKAKKTNLQKEFKAAAKEVEQDQADLENADEIDEASKIVEGLQTSSGQRLINWVASAKEFLRDAANTSAKADLKAELDGVPDAMLKQADQIVSRRATKDTVREAESAQREAYVAANKEDFENAKNRRERRATGKITKQQAEEDFKKLQKEGFEEGAYEPGQEDDTYFSQRTATTVGTTPDLIRSALSSWFFTPEMADKVLTAVNNVKALPAQIIEHIAKLAKERGIDPGKIQAFVHNGRAYMIADRIEPGTERAVFMHEVGTHLGMTDAEVKAVADKIRTWANAKDGTDEFRVWNAVQDRMKNANETTDEELAAYAVEEATKIGITPQAVRQMEAHKTRDASTVAGLIKMFAQHLMDTVKQLFNRQFGRPTAQDLVDFAYGAAHRAVEGSQVKGISALSVASTQAQELADQAMEKASEALKTGSSKATKTLLGWQTLNHIVKTYSKQLPSLNNLKRALDQRTADIAKASREAGDVDRDYAEWKTEVGNTKVSVNGKQETQEYNMGALMGEATLEGIMPGVAIEDQRDYETKKDDAGWVKSYATIQDRWNKIGPKGQALFTRAYKLHEKMFNLIIQAKGLALLRTVSSDSYRKMVEEKLKSGEPVTFEWIKEQLTGKDGVVAPAGAAAQEQFADILEQHSKQSAPYFHVGRFGEYFARVLRHPADGYSVSVIKEGQKEETKKFAPTLDGLQAAQEYADEQRRQGNKVEANLKSATEHFERYETVGEMSTKQAQLEKLFPASEGYQVVAGKLQDSDSQFAAAMPFVKEMLARIDTYDGMTKEDRAATKAMIRKLYIETLPETSSRRVFQHRQGIAGWDPKEMWRSQARRYEIATRQLGYSLHDVDVQNALEGIRQGVSELQKTDSVLSAKMQDVVDELDLRERQSRMTPETPLIDAMNRMSFVMYLAASPSTTVLNLLQPSMITFPVLGGKYGFVKSAKALAKGTATAIKIVRELLNQDFFRPELVLDDTRLANGQFKHLPFLTGNTRKVLQQLVEAGKIDLTQAHEIGNVASGMAHGKMDKVRHFLGLFMHYSELINRVTTGLAAYELASERKESDPVASAMDMIDQTQYSYELANRPRQMGKQGAFGKYTPLAMQFQQYNVQTIELLLREMRKSFGKNATPEEVKAARKTMAGIFGMTTAVAGTLGVPAATMIATILNAIRGDDDDEIDTKADIRQFYSDMFGKDVGEVLSHGIFRGIGMDMSRAGMQDIVPFSRFLSDRRPFKDSVQSLALDMMGPSMGWMTNAVEGTNKVFDGDILGGAAAVLPRFASDIYKGVKVANDGYILDNYGNKIPVAVGAYDTALIGLGFKPSVLAEQREALYHENTRKMLEGMRKTKLKKEMYSALDAADSEAISEGWDKVSAFNEKHPQDRLTRSDVMKGYRQRAREFKGGLETGVPVSGPAKRRMADYQSTYNIAND